MSYSIDSFLEHQNEQFRKIGKLAIVNQISKAESSEKLFHNTNNADDWYRYLINKITNNSPLSIVGDNKLEVITFNYDRSLEMALITALASFYSIDIEESTELIRNFPIIHMYGKLDPLLSDISLSRVLNNERGYGAPCPSKNIEEISYNIKFIHEAREDKTVASANKMIEKAERIYFLGLDLRNKENLNLFDREHFIGKKLIGTVVGLEQAEVNQVNQYFGGNLLTSNAITKSELTIRRLNPF